MQNMITATTTTTTITIAAMTPALKPSSPLKSSSEKVMETEGVGQFGRI